MDDENKQVVVFQSKSLLSMATGTADIAKQTALIQEVMLSIMKDGTHYGTIPGCGEKKVLMQSGAQKLASSFSLRCEVAERVQTDLPNNHREVRFRVVLKAMGTGQIFGEGVGVCTTMEKKYRYKAGSDLIVTDKEVPKAFWDLPKEEWKSAAAQRLLGGKNRTIKKVANKWYIAERNEDKAVENPNPADYWNTIEKIGFKRAQVHAVINTTCCSDIFDQDIDELKSIMDEDDLIEVSGAPYEMQQQMPLNNSNRDPVVVKKPETTPPPKQQVPVQQVPASEEKPKDEPADDTIAHKEPGKLMLLGPSGQSPGKPPATQYNEQGHTTAEYAKFVLNCFQGNIEASITLEMLETIAGVTVEQGWTKPIVRDLMKLYESLAQAGERIGDLLADKFPNQY